MTQHKHDHHDHAKHGHHHDHAQNEHHHDHDTCHCDHEHNDCAEQITDTQDPMLDDALIWHIDGMDCASCVAKIKTAIERLPGAKNVQLSLPRERLSLSLDETLTSRIEIEQTVQSLGYQIMAIDHKTPSPLPDDKPWWQNIKALEVGFAALMLFVAYAFSFAMPLYSFWFFAIATLITLFPVTKRAIIALKNGSPFTIEMLMSIAAIGALVIQQSEEAAVVVLLFTVGEWLEGLAAGRARAGIRALGALTPKTAMRISNGQIETINAQDLKINDLILTRPGERIAADGIIEDGFSSVDESPLTGESVPVSKEVGDSVYAGSINKETALRIRVEKEAADNTLQRIITLVEEAQDAKAPTERFIDGFARIYMPMIVGIALLTGIIPPLFDGNWQHWCYNALALLLIGCPCALVISVPAAIASSLSAGARQGLLVKGGNVIEILAKIDRITFDKTGTLTEGTPRVTDIIACHRDETALLALAIAIEQESNHPLAQAILRYGQENNIAATQVENIKTIAGKGMTGQCGQDSVFIGAPRFAAEQTPFDDIFIDKINTLEQNGKTVIAIVAGKTPLGLIALRDEPREDATDSILALKHLGIESIMLTGDNCRTAKAIADMLGIDQLKAELLPEQKAEAILALKHNHQVAMVGDGINDAPALAAANIGIAMGSGTDVALETADAALLRNHLGDVPALIKLSRATMRNIKQNVTIALGLKAIFLITTLLSITGLWMAILADTGATVLVTMNALRLLGAGHKKTPA